MIIATRPCAATGKASSAVHPYSSITQTYLTAAVARWLLMRGLLDPELCRQARQRMWEVNEVPRCSPTDPDSWRAAFSADESSSDTGNFRSGFNWRSRSIGTEELFLKLLPHNPKVLAIADELMGPGTVAPCDSTGGVYAIMPRPPNVARSPNLGLHVDSHLESRERIGLVGYIADVKPNSGAFGVWPRTHLRCWNLLRQKTDRLHQANTEEGSGELRKIAGGPFTAQMRLEFEAIKRDTYSVDCCGSEGDVVFYHERLGHHAGQNYGDDIRQAVLCRLEKTEASLPEERLLADVEADDIWQSWSDRLRSLPPHHPRGSPRL